MTNNGEDQFILAIYDVCGIQEYIFASSKLRENVGASSIVDKVLKELFPKVLVPGILNKDEAVTNWEKANTFKIKDNPNIKAEIIYNGGGSSIVAYRNKTVYDEVNVAFAKRLLEKTYALTLATACIETKFKNYGEDVVNLNQELEKVKARMIRQRPRGAFPITEQEGITGLPVTRRYKNENISTVQMLKRQVADLEKEGNNKKENEKEGKETEDEQTILALEMEDLISNKGEDGFVAVVHIDGNGMGQAIKKEINSFNECGKYEEAVMKMRKLSKYIDMIFKSVFDKMVDEIKERIINPDSDKGGFSFSPVERNEKNILPIRRLILGGDDITFICNGRLGVPLAAAFLRRIAQVPKPLIPLSACAGVALVHSHFPFNIAYEIAESCCHNAKEKRYQKGQQKCGQGENEPGYIDFHLCRGGYLTDIDDLRENIYGIHKWKQEATQEGGELLIRPYRVFADPNEDDDLSIDRLDVIMSNLPAPGLKPTKEKWPRSRLKKLYETYLLGPQQVKMLLEEFKSRGYKLSSLLVKDQEDKEAQEEQETQEDQKETSIFDALELMDLYERNFLSSIGNLCNPEAKGE
ncbi:MAG: hypothetical protein PHD60_06550 [Clostridia bacterium]|nr:hypothetical protein [Clostridia bacterium]